MKLPPPSRTRLLCVSLGMNACFLAALLAWAVAGPSPHGPPPMLDPARRQKILRAEVDRLFEPLGLSEDQRRRLDAHLDASLEAFGNSFAEAHAARAEGFALVAEHPEDAELFAAQIQASAEEHRRVATAIQAGIRDAALLLAPEQRAKLAKAIRERNPPPPPPP